MLAAAAVRCPGGGESVASRYLARLLAVTGLTEDLEAGRERRVGNRSFVLFTFRLLNVSGVGASTSMWRRRFATFKFIDSTV
jgi:hypothetical protein